MDGDCNIQPLALITGASAGIGATFARRLARDGYRTVLVARRQDRLDALARELGGAETIAADLTNDADLRRVEERLSAEPAIDLLVNNAGFGTQGCFFEIPVDSQDEMHRLHVMATMRLTHAALPGMVKRRKGGIINVSSVSGFMQSPGGVSYCATKAWMNSFTEGLDLELKSVGSPVRVQALCPGFTITEFHDVMKMDRKKVPAWMWLKAEDVVEMSLEGLKRDRPIVVTGGFYKLIVASTRIMPRWLNRALTMRVARRRKTI
jgi:short-subunit dehydrogenase